MAKKILMQNPVTGVTKQGFYGFSWTTLAFGGFPALFRGDFFVGVMFIIFNGLILWIPGIILAFVYNKRYTIKLIENGYRFAGSPGENAMAAAKLGVDLSVLSTPIHNKEQSDSKSKAITSSH